jgi:long-subunit fatty acid transport protein
VLLKNLTSKVAFVTALTLPGTALAEGYYSGFKGAHPEGRAGAFVAKADDISAAHFNPAAFAWQKGTRVQIGNRFSYNPWSYTRAPTQDWGVGGNGEVVTFEEVENEVPFQVLEPVLGVSTDFGLQDFGFALSASAPAGVGRMDFPLDQGNDEGAGGRYMMVGRESQIITYSASIAWKLKQLFGLGVSLQWIAVPKLDYSLVVDATPFGGEANPVSSDFDLLASVSGSDLFTFNAIVGSWLRPAPNWEIGVSGQVIPSKIKTTSELSVEPLSDVITEDVILRRDGAPANDVTLSLPLPMTARLGVRYYQEDSDGEIFDIEFDASYQTWSRVKTFDLETNGMTAELMGEEIPLDTITIQKQWKDTVSLHLGGDYRVIAKKLTVRAGTFFESAVADPDYSHIDFVSGMQFGGALGGSIHFGHAELALAYSLRAQPKVTVAEEDAKVYQQRPASNCEAPYTDPIQCNPNYLGQPGPAVNAGTYVASSHALSLDFSYLF